MSQDKKSNLDSLEVQLEDLKPNDLIVTDDGHILKTSGSVIKDEETCAAVNLGGYFFPVPFRRILRVIKAS